MIYRFLVIIILLCVSPAHAENNLMSMFFKGNEAYKEQDYAKAIEAYEGILEQGHESAAIHYNLGNAYSKEGKAGEAIASYRRALRLAPRDQDILFNLNYILSSKSKQEYEKLTWMKKLIHNHIEFYTLNEMIGMFTFLFMLFVSSFLLARVCHWRKGVRYSIRIFLGVLGVMFLIGYVLKVQSGMNEAVILKKTAAYFEPVADSTVHYQLFTGASVQIIKEEGDWVKMKRRDGRLGWVPSAFVERL